MNNPHFDEKRDPIPLNPTGTLSMPWPDAERLGELLAIVQRLHGQIRDVERGLNDGGSVMVGAGGVTVTLNGADRDACAAVVLRRLRTLRDMALRDLAAGGVAITDLSAEAAP